MCMIRLNLTAATLVFFSSASVFAQDWPSIRGPRFDGSASNASESLSSGPLALRSMWKQPLGSGYSGIVKSGDVLVTAAADSDAGKEFIVALDATSGKTIWRTETGEIYQGANGSFDGPVATPCVDDERAYHLTPFGALSAFRLSDGKVVWSRNLGTEMKSVPNFYGFGASPIVHAGKVILPTGSPEAAITAFDAATGETIWTAGADAAAFQTCVLVSDNDIELLIGSTNTQTFGINPSDGAIRWTRQHENAGPMGSWAVVPVPMPNNQIFLMDGESRSSGVRFSDDQAETVWNGREIRNTYCVPVVVNGVLCTYSSRFLVGLDPATGERLFRQRKPGNGFVNRLGDRLVVATLDGALHIGDVSRDGFEEVVSLKVFDAAEEGQMWALPTLAGNSVYLRSLGAIARVDIRPGGTRQAMVDQQNSVGPSFAEMLKRAELADSPQSIVDAYVAERKVPVVEDGHVHFMLQGEYQDVAVGSDLFGLRQERVMSPIKGTDWFYFGAGLPKADRISYAYFADYKPTSDPRNPNGYVSSVAGQQMEPSFMGPGESLSMSWIDLNSIEDIGGGNGDLAGSLSDHTLTSAAMKQEIEYSVYTPPGYDRGTKELPVIFVHDGEVALEIGEQAKVIDRLIRNKDVNPAVVVFIRWRFYPMMGANGYPEMFLGELMPKVQADFRVSSRREDRSSLGGGFGATLALMASLPGRAQIGRIGCHSPFAFEMLHPMIKQLADIPGQKDDVRIQHGTIELRNPSENWDMARQAVAISEFLTSAGHKVELSTAEIGSDWISWRTQSADMYRFLLAK
ncbi:MAG: PQQ-binding-like beta-propeller repeat protein [Planctomycetota bacterium]